MAESALEKRVDRLEDEVRDIRAKSSNLEEFLGLFIVYRGNLISVGFLYSDLKREIG